MKGNVIVCFTVILALPLSGCYTEPTTGGSLAYDGFFDISDGEFTMHGDLEFEGGLMPQDKYGNITLELYDENGTLLYKEHLGTIHNKSDKLNISVSISTIPHYVIFDSPDIWGGQIGVPYYVRSKTGYQGYQIHHTNNRSELPINPDG